MAIKQTKRTAKRATSRAAKTRDATQRDMSTKAKPTRAQRYTDLFVPQPAFYSVDEFFTQVNGYGTPILGAAGTVTGV